MLKENIDNKNKLTNYLKERKLKPWEFASICQLTEKSIYYYLKTGKIGRLAARKIGYATRGEIEFTFEYEEKS